MIVMQERIHGFRPEGPTSVQRRAQPWNSMIVVFGFRSEGAHRHASGAALQDETPCEVPFRMARPSLTESAIQAERAISPPE